MDLVSMLADVATGGLLGGITGLVGTGITSFIEIKKQKMQNG